MRILHVANFSWSPPRRNWRKRIHNIARYYAIERKISNGLVRNGHNVWDFSYRDTARYLAPLRLGKKLGAQKMNDHLIRFACLYQPQLLLLGHCELVTPAALAAIREELPQCKTAQWWVDPFNDYAQSHLRQKLPCLDAFFATTAPSYYAQLIADDGKTTVPLHYMPNLVDASVESGCAFAAAHLDYDLLFAGTDAVERAVLLHKLQEIPGVRSGFFGFAGKGPLTGADFLNVIGRSKMGLNLSRLTDIPLYSSDRLAQLTGNGCLVFTPRTPGMDMLYGEDEVVYYDDENQLVALIKKYNGENSSWRKIAEAGWRRAHGSYNERRVAKFIVEAVFGGQFSEPYEWLPASVIPR